MAPSSSVGSERRVDHWCESSRTFHSGSFGGGRDGGKLSNDDLRHLSARHGVHTHTTRPRTRGTHHRSFHSSTPTQAGDYYQTLGVPKTANAKEIKKAYYDLAKKYHPDANKDDQEAQQKFQQVQKAYEVLKDPQQKATYDQVGHGNFEQMENGGGGGSHPGGFGGGFGGFGGGFGGGQHVDFEDLFGEFFGGMGGGTRDIQTNVRITLAEVKSGTAKTIRIPETITVDPRTGQRTTHPSRDVDVNLPAGVEDGQRLRVPGEGTKATGPDGRERVGSLYINVDIVDDFRFVRVGNDLVTRVDLGIVDASLGGTAKAPTLDGDVQVKVRPATQSGDQLRLRGRGLPELGTPRIGDLFVKFRVVTPKKLSQRQMKLLKEFQDEETAKTLPPKPESKPSSDEDHATNKPKEDVHKEKAESA